MRLKINKLIKNKTYFKKTYLFFIIITNKKRVKKIKYYNINKFITKKNLLKSLYKNITLLVCENLGLLKINNLKFLKNTFKLIGIKLNKNFYNLTQISNLKNFNYKYNIKILIQSLKMLLKKSFKLI